ncbi:MAG TPA: DUF4253 domain-containing protein [Rhizomicrobium sp.]|nr:DUF4253 domain-containing protein [Rhizomicrobium sp.]
MRRRDILLSTIATAVTAPCFSVMGRDDASDKRAAEIYAQAIAEFPFKRIVVRGEDALPTWQKLKATGKGSPVVLGDDHAVVTMMAAFDPVALKGAKSVSDILRAAAAIKFPEDLKAKRQSDDATAAAETKKLVSGPDSGLPRIYENKDAQGKVVSHTEDWSMPGRSSQVPDLLAEMNGDHPRLLSPTEARAFLAHPPLLPEVGTWPANQDGQTGDVLLVASDPLSGKPYDKVHIALIPTDDWTAIPAYLRWGGWNDCPPPEFHVAALRSWRDRYGAELIGLSFDMMNLRVRRRPQSHDEAIALAREQYVYCRETIEPPKQTYSMLAADLMASNWWYFWWD